MGHTEQTPLWSIGLFYHSTLYIILFLWDRYDCIPTLVSLKSWKLNLVPVAHCSKSSISGRTKREPLAPEHPEGPQGTWMFPLRTNHIQPSPQKLGYRCREVSRWEPILGKVSELCQLGPHAPWLMAVQPRNRWLAHFPTNSWTMLQVTSHYPAWRVNHEETESWDIAEMWWKALESQVVPGFVLNLSIEVQWTGPSLLWCSTKGGLAIEPPKWASCLDVRPDSDAWFVDSFCSKVELKQSWYRLLQTVVFLPRMHQNEFNTKWNRHYARPNPLPQAQMFIFLPKYLKHYQTTLTRLLHALFTQRQKECLLCRPFEYVPAVTLEKSFEIAEMSLLAGSLSLQTWQVIGMCVTRSKEPISFRRWPGCEGTQAGSSCAISNKVWLRLGISCIFSHGMSKRLGLAA